MAEAPVSVVMPVRNGVSCVANALEDLLAGLEQCDDIVVVDDGSEDGTTELVRRWSSRDSRVHLVRTGPRGLVSALNLGIREAQSEWIARADADDRYPVHRIGIQRRARALGVALVTGDYLITTSRQRSSYIPCALGSPFVGLSLINPQRIPHPGVMFHRDAVLAAGSYQEKEFPAEDLGLWLRLLSEGDFVGVAGTVVDWKMSSGSISHSRQSEQRTASRRLLAAWQPTLLGKVDSRTVIRELARYESSSRTQQRELLLLRDLRTWRRRGMRLPGEDLILESLRQNLGLTMRAAWELARETGQRRCARALIANSQERD